MSGQLTDLSLFCTLSVEYMAGNNNILKHHKYIIEMITIQLWDLDFNNFK